MAATYRVTGQREWEDLTPAGQFVPMVEVTFEVLPNGEQGKVNIRKRDYLQGVENVRAVIEQQVEVMRLVSEL